jgi:hypothetical protein
MARNGRTLAAVVAALCCGAAASCDNLADLMGRLSLDAVVPTSRQRPAFATPAVRFQGSALPCAPSPAAPMPCGRAPAFSLGRPLLGRRAVLLGAGSLERSFWAPVEASSRTHSAVSTLAMRSSGSGKVKANVPHEKSKRRQERPSHQVSKTGALAGHMSECAVRRAARFQFCSRGNRHPLFGTQRPLGARAVRCGCVRASESGVSLSKADRRWQAVRPPFLVLQPGAVLGCDPPVLCRDRRCWFSMRRMSRSLSYRRRGELQPLAAAVCACVFPCPVAEPDVWTQVPSGRCQGTACCTRLHCCSCGRGCR